MKIKYFIIIQVILVLTFSSIAFAKYIDIPENSYYAKEVSELSDMGILSGFENGEFKPEDNITRAQLLKLIVIATGNEVEAQELKNSTVFTDLESSHWATGYINYGVDKGLITGYADGSFKPEQQVTYAQAITIILRALGYDGSEMSGVWPQNYVNKANSLGITDGIDLEYSDNVNRANAAVFIQRMLNTKTKNSDKTLAEQSELGKSVEAIITDSWDVNSDLPEGTVVTNIGNLIASDFDGIKYLGAKLDLLVSDNNNILSVKDVVEESNVFFVKSIVGNKINYQSKSEYGVIEVADNTEFYYNGLKTNFREAKDNLSEGSIISLAYIGNKVNYGVLSGPILSEPVVVGKNIDNDTKYIGSIDISNIQQLTVIRNGESANISDIEINDVVYVAHNPFNKNEGIILAYDKKITGTYDEAFPTKSSVNKISISGQELELDGSVAANNLNENVGAFKIDDEITALIGINGKIVDVISPNSVDLSNVAIVLNTRKSMQTPINSGDEDIYYAKLYKTDGRIVEYMMDEDYSSKKGQVVKYGIYDGLAKIFTINYDEIYGYVDRQDKMIGENWLSQNVVILDLYRDVEDDEDVVVNKVYWSEIPSSIGIDNVVHAERGGDFNDVLLLVTDELFGTEKYGIIQDRSDDKFTIMLNESLNTYNDVYSKYTGMSGDVVYIETSGDKLSDLDLMFPKEITTVIQGIDSRRIKVNNKIYKLDDNVIVYNISGDTPQKISLRELSSGEVEYVAIYVGKNSNLIKVITIIEN